MKKFIKRSRKKLQRFWRTEYKLLGKKWYLGSFIAAILILAVSGYSVYHFGIIGFLVFWAKQGVRLAFFYVAKLTFQSLLITGIKRGIIDGVVTPTLKQHIYPYLIPALMSRVKHIGRRIGKILAFISGGFIVVGGAVGMFFYQGIAFLWVVGGFLSTKITTILGFKTLWLFIGHSWIWIKTTSIGTFLQVYLLSWVFDFLGKLIPDRFKRRLRPLWAWPIKKFWEFQSFLDRILGFHLQKKIRTLSRWIEPEYETKKRHKERLQKALERVKKQKKQKESQNPNARIKRFQAQDKKLPPRYRNHVGLLYREIKIPSGDGGNLFM